ncbi:MAG: IS6 family transposase [Oligoflexales bacterium]|nr:IS6 family transposase [Oligoflexales bacterium]
MKRVVSGLSFTHNSGRFTEQTGLPEAVFVQLDFSRHRFPKEIIIQCVHWYLRFNVSTRDLEEMMRDRGIAVDHSSIDAWVNKFSPQIDTIVKKKRRLWCNLG